MSTIIGVGAGDSLRKGRTVNVGLATVVALATVWGSADIFEAELGSVKPALRAHVSKSSPYMLLANGPLIDQDRRLRTSRQQYPATGAQYFPESQNPLSAEQHDYSELAIVFFTDDIRVLSYLADFRVEAIGASAAAARLRAFSIGLLAGSRLPLVMHDGGTGMFLLRRDQEAAAE